MTGWLVAANCDAVHTLDLPNRNRTTDSEVIDTADRDGRVVITKDADFVDSHLLQQRHRSSCSSRLATSATVGWNNSSYR